jgi:hypothetical protein
VGAIIGSIIIFSLTTTLFIWSLDQHTNYNDAVRQIQTLDLQRSSEKTEANAVNYTVAGNKVSVDVQFLNDASQSSQISMIWVLDSTQKTYNFAPLNITLKPGNTSSFSGISSLNVTLSGPISSSETFSSWFITARGNSISGVSLKTQSFIIAQVAQGIGSIALNFNVFSYYNVTKSGSDYITTPFPQGSSGFSVNQPSGTRVGIAFGVTLSNFDQSGAAITLNSGSVLFSIFPTTPQQVRGAPWYIVNVDSNGKISTSYTPVTIGLCKL